MTTVPFRVLFLASLLGLACSSGDQQSPPATGGEPPSAPTTRTTADPRTPRPSPLAGNDYAGSAACAACHPAEAAEWKSSAHAQSVVPATFEDEETIESFIECSGMEISHVLGEKHQVRYLIEDESAAWGEGRWLALPCAWDVGESEVSVVHEDDWRELPWESSCAACHTTDFRASDHGFKELGIGCEECHGPSAPHVAAPTTYKPLKLGGTSAAEELTICASCHLQDGRSLGSRLKFPDTYVAGGSLFDDYEFDWSLLDDASEQVLDVHQKRLIKSVIFDGEEQLRCTSCHSMHGLGHEIHQDVPKQDYCYLCHETDFSVKEYGNSCNVCEF